MNYLFFDTETTGLPKIPGAPATFLSNWPRLVQLAWIHTTDNGIILNSGNAIIKPVGFTIPKDASDIHQITTEIAREKGEPLYLVLERFCNCLLGFEVLVAHNINFDAKVLGAEFLRTRKMNPLHDLPKICTMQSSMKYVGAKNKLGRLKWPNMQELHESIFGTGFEKAHDALVDVEAMKKCFFKMQRLGIL